MLRITDGVLRFMAVAKPPAQGGRGAAEKDRRRAEEPEQAEAPA